MVMPLPHGTSKAKRSVFRDFIAALRKRAFDPAPRVAASARRQLAWVRAGAASYLPPAFAARGDTARVEALRALADATTPP